MIPYLLILFYCKEIAGSEISDKFKSLDKGYNFENLKKYEIITPAEFGAGYLTEKSILKKYFQIEVFGKQYHLLLERQKNFDGTSIEYLTSNNTFQKKILRDVDCFYDGPITSLISNETLNVNLNHCDGLEGIIETENNTIFIEPLKNIENRRKQKQHVVYRLEDVKEISFGADKGFKEQAITPIPSTGIAHRRVRRSGYESFLSFINKARRRVQLYYLDTFKKEKPFIVFLYNEKRGVDTFIGTVWLAKDDKTKNVLLLNGKKTFVAEKNTPDKRTEIEITVGAGTAFNKVEDNTVSGSISYMEVMVVADESVVDFHGRDKVEKYILTMMDIASLVFKHKSLGVKIKFEVVRVVLIDRNSNGFNIYNGRPTRSLKSACNFVTTLANSDPNHPDHFDFAIVLTRKKFGPSGYAQLYSMCSKRRSCALARDQGLTSAFIVAHEVGHLLGLDHDGEGEASQCGSEGALGSVMSAVVKSTYDRFHWSSCSRDVVKENIEYFQCLQNKPQGRKKNLSKKSPGVLYTLDEQCQFSFDKAFGKCNSFSFDPCQMLWCNDPKSPFCKTKRGPALEGTVCGKNKHCKMGGCVEIDNNISDNNNIEESVVNKPKSNRALDGNWGSWSSWTTCSQSCNIGIRERKRVCNNPSPGQVGLPCPGMNYERDVCSTQPCNVRKSYYTILNEQCERLFGNGWRIYSDRAFQVRLRQPRFNLNCTFEKDFCKWKNDLVENEINWERNQGKTPSINTGPYYDHTLKNNKGSYIYMEASSTPNKKKKEGHVARLKSSTLMVPVTCFSMFYYMYGQRVGSLRVNLIHKNGSEVNLWERKGNKGQRWVFMETSIESLHEYKIVIEAIRGPHWAGDIAVDDISINAGLCASTEIEKNPCSISCRSRDAQSFKMNTNLTNGVRCSPGRDNSICYIGKCEQFGCDNKFASSLKLDDCGVCGGNGSSCIKKIGQEEITPKNDYEVLVTLTKGSTFINLTADTIGRYYFGLRKSANTGIYLSMKLEDYYVIEGSTFHFRKASSGRQEIIANGPLSENLEVVVYSYQRNPIKMQYEYFVPYTKEYTYTYEPMRWTQCSRTCGIGKKESIIGCKRVQDNVKVEARYCKHLKKPLYVQVCRLSECPIRTKWLIKKWSSCSKTCGGGKQIRIVACKNIDENSIVSNSHCSEKSTPVNKRSCNTQVCPKEYRWKENEWSKCSLTCGNGVKTRTVVCTDVQNSIIVDNRFCKNKKPETAEPCNMPVCDNYIYEVRSESVCSRTCGGGIKARIVYCINKNSKEIVSKRYCDGPSPLRIAPCNSHVCPEYEWKTLQLGSCSVTCGRGIINRDVVCINKNTGTEVDEKHCRMPKPNTKIQCSNQQCQSLRLSYADWSNCSTSCGEGAQRRRVRCVDHNWKQHPLEMCDRTKIVIRRSCQSYKCATPEMFNCNFDSNNFCNWGNVRNDVFDWTLGKFTPSEKTGPLFDHTNKLGLFTFIEASRPRIQGDTARLSSPLTNIRDGCLSFWYHMRGLSIGKLTIYMNDKVVFEVNRSQGSSWKLGQIDTNVYKSAANGYRFVIEASVGLNVYGDIAIDDISFRRNSCRVVTGSLKRKEVIQNCREISPFCSHPQRKTHCQSSAAYRTLCCETCSKI